MVVSLELVKEQVVLDNYDGDDNLLTHYVETAEEYVITETHRTKEELIAMSLDGESFPKMLQHAVLLLSAYWYSRREPGDTVEVKEAPYTIQAMIKPYRKLVHKQ